MTARAWLAVLLLVGALIRVELWLVYEPIAYPDTPTYMRVAGHILRGDFSDYEGRRTPGYPLVLAAAGLDGHAAWALQMLAGLAISAMLFFIALRLTGRPAIALLAGMSYNLNLAQLFFEANLLSETASTLTVTATAALLLVAFDRVRQGRPVAGSLFAVGVVAGFAVLTRPQFVFLPILAGALVAWSARSNWRPAVGRAAVAAAPGLLLILSWCGVNYTATGFFTLSTQTGVGLFDHSLAFVELAPERYATIREIALTHRASKLAVTGRHNASWDALPELMSATGLSFPAMANELQRMSIELFVRHPFRYATGVVQAWVDFWMAPNYWRLDRLRPSWVAGPVVALWRVEQPLLRLGNGVFLAIAAAALLSARFRRRADWDLALTGVSAIVLGASLLQALAIWVENARYAIPVQPLVILVVISLAGRRLPVLGSAPTLVGGHSIAERGTST